MSSPANNRDGSVCPQIVDTIRDLDAMAQTKGLGHAAWPQYYTYEVIFTLPIKGVYDASWEARDELKGPSRAARTQPD
jgi:hypothetical protein